MSREPRVSRPRFRDYGIHEDSEGMLAWAWAAERLEASRNYWISTAAADGGPHAMPVWGVWLDGALAFGTNPASRKGRNLARDSRVAVHLESGDEVVILEGDVEPAEPDERIAGAYEAKYDFRPELGPGWYTFRPRRAYAWLERDYPKTATRFDW